MDRDDAATTATTTRWAAYADAVTRRPALVPSTPTSHDTSAPRRGRVLAALVGLLVLGSTGGVAAPAVAHDALTGSNPPDGSTVATPPPSVDLTFGEPPLGIGAEVQVTGPGGAVVGDGDLVLTDTTVSQPLAAELPAGAYAVAWRVTSSDGHPISGELSFTATAGTVPAPAPTPADDGSGPAGEPSVDVTEPAPGATVTEDPPGPGTADPADSADPADDAADDAGGSPSPLPWVVGAVLLLAAAGAATWAAHRRRSGTGPSS